MILVKVSPGGSVTLHGKKDWIRIDINAIADGYAQIGIDAPTDYRCSCTPGKRSLTVRVKPVGVRILALEQDGDAVVLGMDLPRSMRLQEGAQLLAGPLGKRRTRERRRAS